MADRPFAGHQVALVGKLAVLSRREARAIVERLGGTFSPAPTARTTILVGAVQAHEQPPQVERVLSEDDLCREGGLPDLETLRSQYYPARDLRAMYPVLRDEHFQALQKWGLIRPVAGRCSFADVHVVRQAAGQIERGVPFTAVLRTLSAVRQGQLALDFQAARAERAPARVVSLPGPAPADLSLFPTERSGRLEEANRALAAKYFLEGEELDDGERRDLEAAAAAYRRAAVFDPQLVPAIVNLANIHYERDELVEAEALYEKAIRVDTECF